MSFNLSSLIQTAASSSHAGGTSGPTRVSIVSSGGDGVDFDHSKNITLSNVPTGALMIALFATGQSPSMTSVIDGVNTWLPITQINSNTSLVANHSAFYCINASTSNTITANCVFNNGASIYQVSIGAWTANGTWALANSSSGVAQASYGSPISFTLSSPSVGIIFGQVNNNETGSGTANVAILTPIGSVVDKEFPPNTPTEMSEFDFEIINSSALANTVMTADITNVGNTYFSKASISFACFTNT